MIHRIQSNGLTIKDAVKLDFFENLYKHGSDFKKYLTDVDFGLGDIPVWDLKDKAVDLYRSGGFIGVDGSDGLVRVYDDEIFVGIGRIEGGILKPKRTMNQGV